MLLEGVLRIADSIIQMRINNSKIKGQKFNKLQGIAHNNSNR